MRINRHRSPKGMEFFTSDLHFGHHNIIEYCKRPFKSGEHMNERLIAEINMRCAEEDTLYHIGDFCCYGKARGVEGMRKHAKEYEALIKPKVVHIKGNHDKNNKVKSMLRAVLMILGKYQVWVQHIPPSYENAIPEPCGVTAYLCGHVHEKWKTDTYKGKPVINVGCDMWNYRPIKKDELIGVIKQQLTI